MGSLQESLEWRKPSRDVDRERKGFAERGGGRGGGGGEGTPEDYRKEENTDEKSFTSMCSSGGAEAMSPRRWS